MTLPVQNLQRMWSWLRRVSPVKTCHSLERVPDLPESVLDSSGTLYEPFAWWDGHDYCWRTWQGCLIEGLELFSGPWPLGYDAQWHCIPASAVGAPHRRDRIWIIAHDRSQRKQGIVFKKISRQPAFSWCENVRRVEDLRNRPDLYPSALCRNINGISKELDSLGNAVVPQIPELIGHGIMEDIKKQCKAAEVKNRD